MVAKRAVILIEGKHYNNLGICTLISLIYFSTIKKKKLKPRMVDNVLLVWFTQERSGKPVSRHIPWPYIKKLEDESTFVYFKLKQNVWGKYMSF